jgi:TRAP-type mannitol/chloroaromatic compound transport system permease small subunit
MGFLLKISALIDSLNRLVGKAMIWLILAAAVISAGNAIARKAFSMGSNAWLEIQWYLFAAAFMLGAAATFLNNGHVRIDVLAGKLSARKRALIDIGGILIFLLPLCWFMIDFSWPIVSRAYEFSEMSSNAGGLIRWPVYAMLPAGFALLGLQAISELIKRIGFLSGQAPDPLAQNETPAPPAIPDAATEGADGGHR